MNIWLFTGIVFLLSLTTIALALRRRTKLGATVAVIALVYVRIVRHLGTDIQWHHDSYFYFMTVRAIQRTAHLSATSDLKFAWNNIEHRLDYFILPIITAVIGIIPNVTNPNLRTFTPSLFGIVFFFAVWAIYRHYLDGGWALVAAFVYIMLDAVLGHQIIFHQQVVGTLMMILLVFPILINKFGVRYRALCLGFGTALIFSHVAAPFFGLFMLTGLIISFSIIPLRKIGSNLKTLPQVVLIYASLLLAVSIFAQTSYFLNLLVRLGEFDGFSIGLGGVPKARYHITGNPTVLNLTPLATKAIFSTLAIPAAYLALQEKHARLRILFAFAAVTGFSILFGLVLIGPPVIGRLIAFGYLFATVISVYVLAVASNKLSDRRINRVVHVCISLILVGIIITNVLVSVHPSRVDPSADISADGYPDIEPVGQQFAAGGHWLHYTNQEVPHYAVYTYRAAVFYYGLRPSRYLSMARSRGYIVSDSVRFPGLGDSENRVYSNGRLVVIKGDAARINQTYPKS